LDIGRVLIFEINNNCHCWFPDLLDYQR